MEGVWGVGRAGVRVWGAVPRRSVEGVMWAVACLQQCRDSERVVEGDGELIGHERRAVQLRHELEPLRKWTGPRSVSTLGGGGKEAAAKRRWQSETDRPRRRTPDDTSRRAVLCA